MCGTLRGDDEDDDDDAVAPECLNGGTQADEATMGDPRAAEDDALRSNGWSGSYSICAAAAVVVVIGDKVSACVNSLLPWLHFEGGNIAKRLW